MNIEPKAFSSLITALAIGLSSTSCSFIEGLTKGYCMKTTDGMNVCIKAENLSCNDIKENAGKYIWCKASGMLEDNTGYKAQWSTASEANDGYTMSSTGSILCLARANGAWEDPNSLPNKDTFTCSAARKFNRLGKLKMSEEIQFIK